MATKATSANGTASADVSMQDLTEQVQILKKDISALTNVLGDYTKGKGAQVADTAKTKAQDAATLGAEKALEAQLKTEDFIRTQPATALGLAAGIGFLVGIMTARR